MSEPSTLCLIAADVLSCEFAISAHAKDVLKLNPNFNPFEEVLDYLETAGVHRIHIHSVVMSDYL